MVADPWMDMVDSLLQAHKAATLQDIIAAQRAVGGADALRRVAQPSSYGKEKLLEVLPVGPWGPRKDPAYQYDIGLNCAARVVDQLRALPAGDCDKKDSLVFWMEHEKFQMDYILAYRAAGGQVRFPSSR